MTNKMQFRSRWVLITGASSGLGREMAVQLATEHGANLILVARREAQLIELKNRLEQDTGVKCHVIAADLADPNAVNRVFHEANAFCDVYGVILNAGITHFGRHSTLDWTGFEQMMAVNVMAVTRLLSLFSPYLVHKNQAGGMMVISSMAGLLPVPYQAAYAGTKAFVTNFSQSLNQELHDENISITVFSPGGIDTEMTQKSNLRHFENTAFLQDAQSCAREGIAALESRQSLAVSGWLNRQQLFLTRFVPRNLINFVTRKTYERVLDKP